MVAGTNAPLDSDAGKALIDHVRVRSEQDGLTVLVGGYQATSLDLDRILYGDFPYAILFILVTTYLLLLITFRSVLLPLKAVLMDALSVAATFGVLVHLFQWGQLGLFPPVTFIDAITPILLFCILFGLSMDYEVFLLSRMREEWLQTSQNAYAVARGLEKTAGVITSAALLFIIVTGAFAFATMETTQEIGVGMAIAVLVDATTIRMLLGHIRPTSGRGRILGHDITRERAAILPQVGAIVESPVFYPILSGRDNLRVFARTTGNEDGRTIARVLEQVGLSERAQDKVKTYSLGMQEFSARNNDV